MHYYKDSNNRIIASSCEQCHKFLIEIEKLEFDSIKNDKDQQKIINLNSKIDKRNNALNKLASITGIDISCLKNLFM